MARTRQIRPGLWLDEDLLEIEERTGLGAFVRFAFMGLIAHADREGRFRWRPRTLQAQIDPCRSFSLADCMSALVESGHVERYEVGGEAYGRILNFLKHQKIDSREMASKLPASPSENPAEVTPKAQRSSDEGAAKVRHNSVSEVPRYRGTEEEGPSGTPSPPAPKGGGGTAPTEAGGDEPADAAEPPGSPATRRSAPKPPGKARKKTAAAAAKPDALAGTALEGLTPRAVLEAWDAEWLQMVGEPHTWANGRASAALASQLLHRLAPTGIDLGDIRETMRLAIGGTTDFHRNFANFATRFDEIRANARARARASPGHGRRSAMDTHAADLLGELNDVGRPAARLRVES